MHLDFEILLSPYYMTTKLGVGNPTVYLWMSYWTLESLIDSLKLTGMNGQQPKGQRAALPSTNEEIKQSNQKIMIVQVPFNKNQIYFFLV